MPKNTINPFSSAWFTLHMGPCYTIGQTTQKERLNLQKAINCANEAGNVLLAGYSYGVILENTYWVPPLKSTGFSPKVQEACRNAKT